MARNRHYRPRDIQDGFWTGFALIVVGAVLVVDKMGIYIPRWLLSWQTLLIFIGIVIGLRHGFRNPTWLILVAVGGFFLTDEIVDDLNIKKYFWPVMIIGVGLLFMLRPRRRLHYIEKEPGELIEEKSAFSCKSKSFNDFSAFGTHSAASTTGADQLDSVSIFGGVKKVITPKNFQGGDIVCFMGGAEINFSQADIQGPVELEVFQAFGGTKLVVPPHWEIRSEAVAIFAGIEDKRHAQPGTFDPNKVLIIKGTTIFGGIEIKSY